ncbi:MAG: TonB-dependent receptor [Sphingomonadaceae bacterium]
MKELFIQKAGRASIFRQYLGQLPGVALAAPAAFMFVAASPVWAVSNPGATVADGFGDVVVTARKRSETALDVPASVTAIGADSLARYGVADLTKAGQLVPQVNLGTSGGSGGGFLSIRGIGTSPNNSGFDQAVSINIDGVQVSRGRLITAGFFDLQQVEVLKGPQALFFGKNSPAGVVSVISKGPGDRIEGYARVAYEFGADEVIGEGAISGPLTDTLGARVAVRARKMQGFIRNLAQPVANPFGPAGGPGMLPGASDKRLDERAFDGRLTLDFHPTDQFSSVLKVHYSTFEDDGFASNWQGFGCAPGEPLVTVGGIADPFDDCKIDKKLSRGDMAPEVAENWPLANGGIPYRKFDAVMASWNNSLEMDNFSLTSVTGYMDYTSKYFDTSDATVFGYYAAAERDKSWAFSQEVRLLSSFDGPVNAMIGGFYQKASTNFDTTIRIATVGIDPATGKYQSFERDGGTKGETWSFFGQLMVDITDDLELAGGARWTRETKNSNMQNTYVHPALEGVLSRDAFPDRFRDNNVSPEVTLRWRPTRELMFYGAYRTGYKSGGYSLASILLGQGLTTVEGITFQPEKAEGFELGFRSEWLDRRLRLEGSVYRYTYKNLQVTSFDPASVSFIIANAASARQQGAELSATFHATPELTLRTAGAYNRSRYRNFPNASCYAGQSAATGCDPLTGSQDLSGRPTTRAPDWSANAGFTYEFPISRDWQLGLSSDAFYTSGHYVSDVISPAAYQDKFIRWDAAVTVSSVERWQFALIGRNLTNKIYLVDSNDKPGGMGTQQYGSIGRPREILLQATVNF